MSSMNRFEMFGMVKSQMVKSQMGMTNSENTSNTCYVVSVVQVILRQDVTQDVTQEILTGVSKLTFTNFS